MRGSREANLGAANEDGSSSYSSGVRMSVGARIFLGIVLIQLTGAALIVGWYFYSLQIELGELTRQKAQEAVIRSIDATEAYFRPAATVAEAGRALLAQEVLSLERPAQLERYFFDQLQRQPLIAGLYVGRPDGSFFYVMRSNEEATGGTRTKFIRQGAAGRDVSLTWRDTDFSSLKTASDPEDTYDPRTRAWYRGVLDAGNSIWTEPYVFFTSRRPGITLATPILNGEGEVAAILGVDMELLEISRFLASNSLGMQGSAFIATAKGEVIAHSAVSSIVPNSAAGDDSLRYRGIAELEGVESQIGARIQERFFTASAVLAESTEGVRSAEIWEETADGRDYFVAVGQISDISWPWQIVVVVPRSNRTEVGRASDLTLIAIILFGTALACMLGYIFSRSLGRPLATLLRNARLAQNGNVEVMEPVATGCREIDEVAQAVRDLAEVRRRDSTAR